MTRFPLAVTLLLGLAVAAPTSASAQVSGNTTLILDGPAGRSLVKPGTSLSGAAGAAVFGRRAVLPVGGGEISERSSVLHRGTLRLTHRQRGRRARVLTLASLRVELGSSTRISALVGDRRRTILASVGRARPQTASQSGAVRLQRTRMRFSAPTIALIGRELGVRVGRGTAGTLALDAELGPPSTRGPIGLAPGPGGPGVAPGSAAPLAPVAPSARPATAVDVVSATIGWHIRESFIQYLQGGEGTSVSGGAIAGPATVRPGSDRPLNYDYQLPFVAGWYDPPSDTAVLRYGGSVGYSYRERGIDYTTSDGEIELRGAGPSLATFAFNGRAGAAFDGSRGRLVDLNPAGAPSRGIGPDGRTRIFDQIPATVPSGAGSSVFAGFYFEGDPYGWMSISFTPAG